MYRHHGLILVLAVAGCAGSIGDGTSEDDSGTGGSRKTGGSGGSRNGGSTPAACDLSPDLAPAPVRRLSHTEFNATLRDLFPGVSLQRIDLPADPESRGFQNRATLLVPTDILVDQWKTAAFDVAAKAMAKPDSVLPCAPTEAACGAEFVTSFGLRAFRRPLTTEEAKTYTDFFNQKRTEISFNGAVRLTIQAMLLAPQFLYRLEFGDADSEENGQVALGPYEVASRLSYFLWQSMPDKDLFDAAAEKRLSSPDDVAEQARRMLTDSRARSTMIDFHRQWLGFDKLYKEEKDPGRYPAYNDQLQAAIREESDRFVGKVMYDGDGTLQALLTSTDTMVNGDLAKLYGVSAPANGWADAQLNPDERGGFLTRANFLAAHGHKLSGSPPLRSVFILDHLLCETMPPPPGDADTSEPKPLNETADMTNRELFEARTASQSTCPACHNKIDPVGFALEHYDAIGAYRDMDNGKDVNATATIKGTPIDGEVTGGIELSQRLADAPETSRCMTGLWYGSAHGRDEAEQDTCRIDNFAKALADANGDIRELLVMIASGDDFLRRPVVTP